jgi:glucose-6-phosphate isomerase
MVILPYKDSLLLFSRYLQQLVMESLGKEYDLDGNRVCVAHVANLTLMIFILCPAFWMNC